MKFDAKGKPNFTSVPDSWNIRNISHEMRVRPVPDNPEMLLYDALNTSFRKMKAKRDPACALPASGGR